MIWLPLMIFPMDLAHKNINCFMNHRIIEVGEENDGLGHLALLPDCAVSVLFIRILENKDLFRAGEYNAKFKREF